MLTNIDDVVENTNLNEQTVPIIEKKDNVILISKEQRVRKIPFKPEK